MKSLDHLPTTGRDTLIMETQPSTENMMTMMSARILLAKALRCDAITEDDKLSVIDTQAELEWYRLGLVSNGLDTHEAIAAVARRKVALQRRGE